MAILKIVRGQSLELVLSEITHPVRLLLTSPDSPEPELLNALADLRRLCPLISLVQRTDPGLEADTLAVVGETDRGLRFLGPPLGTELAALVSAVVVVGRRSARLPASFREALGSLNRPVRLEVFTTPT
ncbi:MAG: hypothetical protein ACE5H9_05840 [Anaerolineae bacterium]